MRVCFGLMIVAWPATTRVLAAGTARLAVGIDLGTKTSSVAISRAVGGRNDVQTEIIINRAGMRTTPSVVSLEDNEVSSGPGRPNVSARWSSAPPGDSLQLSG